MEAPRVPAPLEDRASRNAAAAEGHPGIDPATGKERSVLQMLGDSVKAWRADGSLDDTKPLPDHDRGYDADRDGWQAW